jgi:hypothetical protein
MPSGISSFFLCLPHVQINNFTLVMLRNLFSALRYDTNNRISIKVELYVFMLRDKKQWLKSS